MYIRCQHCGFHDCLPGSDCCGDCGDLFVPQPGVRTWLVLAAVVVSIALFGAGLIYQQMTAYNAARLDALEKGE